MWRDDAYLLDMLIHARHARDFNAGGTLKNLEADHVRRHATLRVLQVIGEAASKVSEECRQSNPSIPWHDIIGLRHRLVHDYPRIDLPKIWRIVDEQIPPLIAILEAIVPPDTPQ